MSCHALFVFAWGWTVCGKCNVNAGCYGTVWNYFIVTGIDKFAEVTADGTVIVDDAASSTRPV